MYIVVSHMVKAESLERTINSTSCHTAASLKGTSKEKLLSSLILNTSAGPMPPSSTFVEKTLTHCFSPSSPSLLISTVQTVRLG